jgi:hypothetical protein
MKGYSPYNVRFEVFTAVTMKNGVFGMLHPVALVRTDVSKELSTSFIRVTRIGELGTLAVTINRPTLHRLLVNQCMLHQLLPILVTLMMEERLKFYVIDISLAMAFFSGSAILVSVLISQYTDEQRESASNGMKTN